MTLRDSLEEPVSRYMSVRFTKVGVDESIYHAARLMQENETTEAVVVDRDAPVGIITEHDILYKVVAAGMYPQHVKTRDVMSTPLESIDATSKVADAISRMASLGIRRLGVTQNGRIVGLITQKAMTSGDAAKVVLPELAVPDAYTCPYCNAVVRSRELLSKHIDRTHMGGAGLLEGDKSKW